MYDNDFASTESDEGFSAEEQAAFDAYERGEDAPAAAPAAPAAEAAPAGGDETGAAAAPEGGEAVPGSEIDPNGQARDEKGKFVPHGAFHEERERRKAVEKELNDLREKYARGDERLRVLSEAMQARPAAAAQPAAEAPKVPNPAEDVFGYVEHLKAEIEALKGGFTKQTEEQRVATEQKAVHDDYVADAQRFVAAEPSFIEAYNHLYQSRAMELAAAGVPQEQLIPAIRAEEMEIAAACRRAGVSPAERIFAIAKARGFVPKAAEAAPAAAPAPAPAETAAQKAERVAAGQAGPGKSLSAAGGAPAGEVTLEMLGSMSEAEFEAFATKNPEKVARLMGAEA